MPIMSSTRAARVRDGLAALTYAEASCSTLRTACASLGWDEPSTRSVTDRFSDLLSPWGDRPMGLAPHQSFMANDSMPVEVGFAWTPRGGGEVRAYFEPMCESPALKARQDAGVALTQRLESEDGVSLEQYRVVEDLFLAADPSPPFSIAHGVVWHAGSPPWYKVFLNPNGGTSTGCTARVGEAMRRLGLADPWAEFTDHIGRPDFDGSDPELVYFSLDLRTPRDARVRVYLRRHGTTAAELDHVGAAALSYQPGAIERACTTVSGHAGPYLGKAPLMTVAFRTGVPAVESTTLNVPLDPNIRNDDIARDRVCRALHQEGLDPSGYLTSLHAVADEPLTRSNRQSWFSYRPGPVPRFAVYVNVNAYEPVHD